MLIGVRTRISNSRLPWHVFGVSWPSHTCTYTYVFVCGNCLWLTSIGIL